MANIAASQKRASRAELAAHAPETLITFRVSRLAQALARLVDASVRATLDLSSRQWRVLVILNRLGTATSGDVARMANYDHSQVSRVAYELAQLGLVTQQNDAGDRRRQLLTLTAAGIDCLRKGLPGSVAREARFRSRLSAADYDRFCRALQSLEEEADRMLAEAGRQPPVRPPKDR